jgi:hypothetical protein
MSSWAWGSCGTRRYGRISVAEDAVASVQSRHGLDRSNALGLPNGFEVGKEEGTVLNDRSASGPAELIALERRLRGGGILEEIPRVEGTVPEKLINAAVERIRARSRNGVNDSTRGLAVLRRIVTGKDRKFLNGIHTETSAENTAGSAVRIVV